MRDTVKKSVNIILIVVFVVLLGGYSYGRARNIIFGPQIEILEPSDGDIMEDDLLTIKGKVKNVSYLFLNGRQIFIDENENFKEELLLHYGYNIIEITAKDRFDQTEKKTLQIVYK
jgi:hypothetical protein